VEVPAVKLPFEWRRFPLNVIREPLAVKAPPFNTVSLVSESAKLLALVLRVP
jgi:hypothetical protein